MFKTTALDSVGNQYVDKHIPTSTPGTRLEAGDRNIEMDELVNAVEGAGLTLDPTGTIRNQLSMAISGYSVDSNEADQGAAGSGRSVKDLVDAIGSNSATLLFSHHSSASTTYTFSTTEIIPSNIKVVIQKGAILSDGGGSANLTIGNFPNPGLFKCFDWTGSGDVFFGSGAVKEVIPQWWDAKGDGTTNDTATINKAIASMNLSLNTEPQMVLYFPPGTYLVTPGGLSKMLCNVWGPEAVFKASSDTSGAVIHIEYRTRYALFHIRGAIGYNTANIDSSNPIKDSNTTGLRITDTTRAEIYLHKIAGFKVGLYLDSYYNSVNAPTSTAFYKIGQIMWNTHGIIQRSGTASPGKSEANYFKINYLVGNTHGIWLDNLTNGDASTAYVCSNLYEIIVFEMHYAANEIGFTLSGAKCYENKLIVHGSLVPPTGTGKIVYCTGGANNNYIKIPYVDWTKVDSGTGYNIWDISTSLFGYPTSPDNGGRSQIVGTAAPTSDRWRRGDICWNRDPSAGGTPGWVCVASGAPGTWKAMANLAA